MIVSCVCDKHEEAESDDVNDQHGSVQVQFIQSRSLLHITPSPKPHPFEKGSRRCSRKDVDLLSPQLLHRLCNVVRQLLHRCQLEHAQRENPAGQSKAKATRILSRYTLTLSSTHYAQLQCRDTAVIGTALTRE